MTSGIRARVAIAHTDPLSCRMSRKDLGFMHDILSTYEMTDSNGKCNLFTLTIMSHVYCTFLVYILIDCCVEHGGNKDRGSPRVG